MSPVYKLSDSSLLQGRQLYTSMLAGNPAYVLSDFESIATITVGAGGESSVEFQSIPSTFKHLQIRCFARTSAGTFGVDALRYQMNNNTQANYSWHHLRGDGSSTESSAGANSQYMEAQRILGTTTGSGFGAFVIDLLDYTDTNKYKTVRVLGGVDTNGTVGGIGGAVVFASGSFRNTAAITRFKLYGAAANFAQYSHFALYGIRG